MFTVKHTDNRLQNKSDDERDHTGDNFINRCLDVKQDNKDDDQGKNLKTSGQKDTSPC